MASEWTAKELMERVRGFQPACIIIAAAELDVFTILSQTPLDARRAARRIGGDERATAILLDALAATGLLRKRQGRYRTPRAVADVLAERGGHCELGMARHLGNCLRGWAQLASVVRAGRPARRRPSVRGAAEDTASFIRAMHERSGPIAAGLIKSLGRLRFSHVLDIGGASGTWTAAFLRSNPGAVATIFDLPGVIPMARRRMARDGLAGRVRMAPGDFYADPLPAGADLVWLSAIVHQNSREENRALFRKAFAALVPGGQILIRDVVMEDSRQRPAMGALFAVNMLVNTAGGGTYTFGELRDDLAAAGFARVQFLRRGEEMDSVIAATKPRSRRGRNK